MKKKFLATTFAILMAFATLTTTFVIVDICQNAHVEVAEAALAGAGFKMINEADIKKL